MSFLSENLRTLVSLLLTLTVVILALRGDRDAIMALMGAFGVLMGGLWGERAALKKPGETTSATN